MGVVPSLKILTREDVEIIHEAALRILSEVGVMVPIKEVIEKMKEVGADVDGNIVRIPADLVTWAIKVAPKSIELFNREGKLVAVLKDNNVYFNPGSAATKILDYDIMSIRNVLFKDLIEFAIIADHLENIAFQSTALVPSDVVIDIRDKIRLYPILLVSNKPIVTGAFTEDGIPYMMEILNSVCEAYKKPMAIFDVCPSPPLKWSKITLKNLVDCAKKKIPAEIIPMPQIGATAPVTIAGALVQHHAEALSGITIAQAINKGSPVIYGGSPCVLDMRYGTPLITAPESVLLSLAYVDIAKELRLPTHTYMGLADSKNIDYQAGIESTIGAVLAAIKGVNVISGPGMLGYENVQSMEKLVLDNELCGYVLKICEGFNLGPEELAIEVIKEVGVGGQFLSHKHTLKNYRKELYFAKIFDRTPISSRYRVNKVLLKEAHKICKRILQSKEINLIDKERRKELEKTIIRVCGKHAEKAIRQAHKILSV